MPFFGVKVMPFRTIIAWLGKRIYHKDYIDLRNKICEVYLKLDVKSLREGTFLLEKLLVLGEDRRFKYHIGFDLIAIVRAIRNRIIYNKIEGASTIEQQIVRVITNDFKISYRRKIKEIFLATTISQIIPKNEIPFFYLSIAYYGPNTIGLKMVANHLKITDFKNLTENTAADIVARIKYPETFNSTTQKKTKIDKRKKHLLYLYHNTIKNNI